MNTDRRWDTERQEWVYPADWRLIETAPKDGTRILIYDRGRINIAFWDENAELGENENAPGWQIFSCENDVYYSTASKTATHWMHLPEAPNV